MSLACILAYIECKIYKSNFDVFYVLKIHKTLFSLFVNLEYINTTSFFSIISIPIIANPQQWPHIKRIKRNLFAQGN